MRHSPVHVHDHQGREGVIDRAVARLRRAAPLCAALLMAIALPAAAGPDNPTPTLEIGASFYNDSCALCHGPHGLGEGMLPLRIRRYPNTNLVAKPRFHGEALREVIIYGGTRSNVSEMMPPMGNELTWTQVESAAMFIELLREDGDTARQLLQRNAATIEPNLRNGMHIYNSRCTLCHGDEGLGDGRMARVIKDPPPANLTASTLSDGEMLAIISAGGEAVGRSGQMPPWADQLSLPDIQSVILYVRSLRAP